MSEYKLYLGDCLEAMKEIPSKSINLVLIDPPYNIGKDKWDKWKTVEDYVEFMGKVFKECERVLKDNGSFYFFHNDFLQIVELQNFINKHTEFKFKQLITWNKTKFKKYAWTNRDSNKCRDRNWFPNVEYCLYYTFQDETGLNKVYSNKDCFKTIKQYLRDERKKVRDAGFTDRDLRIMCGVSLKGGGLLSHYWGDQQWMLPTEKHYKSLQQTGYFQKPYEELRQEYEELRQEYEELRYVFNLEEVKDNISCVWEIDSKNSGHLHNCQKPLAILEKIIKTSSNEGDLVLDCFMGSGSTGVACMNTNRKFIGIEKEEKYYKISEERLKEALLLNKYGVSST